MTYIKAMKQALEALVKARKEMDALPHSLGYSFDHLPAYDEAIANLRTAIEEVEKAEPATWRYVDCGDEGTCCYVYNDMRQGEPLYLHPAPLTVPENLDELTSTIAKEVGINLTFVCADPPNCPDDDNCCHLLKVDGRRLREGKLEEFARRLVAAIIEEQGR